MSGHKSSIIAAFIADIYHDGFFDREADAGTIEPDGVMDRYATMNYKP
jgi:hypothetical protein